MSKLRIAYIPQVPGTPFYKEVADLNEAKLVADTLVDFSTFEFNQNVKPDYTDFLDLEEFDEDENEWLSWDDDGLDFSDWMGDQ